MFRTAKRLNRIADALDELIVTVAALTHTSITVATTALETAAILATKTDDTAAKLAIKTDAAAAQLKAIDTEVVKRLTDLQG